MRYEIKELEIGEILDHSLRLLRDHFRYIAVLVGFIIFPIQFVVSSATTALTPDYSAAPPEDPEFIFSLLAVAFGGNVVVMFFTLVAEAAICFGIAQKYLGHEMAAWPSVQTGLRRLPALFGLAIVSYLGIFAGTLFCIVPGVYLALIWYIAVPVLMLEGSGPVQALTRSAALMNGHRLRVFVIGFVLFAIGAGVGFATQIIPIPYVSDALISAGTALFVGLRSIVITVVYFSARCRLEQLDLHLIAQATETAVAQEEPAL